LQEKDDQLAAISEKYDADIALLKNAIDEMQQLLKNPDSLVKIANAKC
jgi:phage host-nuclease inhibitor protein Gam